MRHSLRNAGVREANGGRQKTEQRKLITGQIIPHLHIEYISVNYITRTGQLPTNCVIFTRKQLRNQISTTFRDDPAFEDEFSTKESLHSEGASPIPTNEFATAGLLCPFGVCKPALRNFIGIRSRPSQGVSRPLAPAHPARCLAVSSPSELIFFSLVLLD